MDKRHYDEMCQSLDKIMAELNLKTKKIFLFGHCGATLELIDLLESKGITTAGILDNSDAKQGITYKETKVYYPAQILELAGNSSDDSMVLITSRFYASMQSQLRKIGYTGLVRKLIDFNTYADYSLSDDTIHRMTKRERDGEKFLASYRIKYADSFMVFFPFEALGDVYYAMSYWETYAKEKCIERVVFFVCSKAQAQVIRMFGGYAVEVCEQKKLDAMIQAAIFTMDSNTFIAHQDRPYVVNLSKALYLKKISLDKIYCCGIFGLPEQTKPNEPKVWIPYENEASIPSGEAVIFSPYAKSVPAIDAKIWEEAVSYYLSIGKKCYTNVVGDEKTLPGTEAISPTIREMIAVVNRAGTFVGIRSGLCDVIRTSKAKMIALYPDYYYSDTKWKAIDMYFLNEFTHNIVVSEEISWEKL